MVRKSRRRPGDKLIGDTAGGLDNNTRRYAPRGEVASVSSLKIKIGGKPF